LVLVVLALLGGGLVSAKPVNGCTYNALVVMSSVNYVTLSNEQLHGTTLLAFTLMNGTILRAP